MRAYIRDDNGHAWYFEDGAMRLLLADLQGIPHDQNGYPCDGLLEGIELLMEYGFITPIDEDNTPVYAGPPFFRWDDQGSKKYFNHKYSKTQVCLDCGFSVEYEKVAGCSNHPVLR